MTLCFRQAAQTAARRPAQRLILAFVIALVAGIGHPGRTQAQTVDWVLNLDDIGSDPLPAGGTITYNVRVDNNGTGAAPATTLNLTVPATTTLVSATGGITGCAPVPATGVASVTCNVPPLAVGGTVGLTLGVTTTQLGTVSFQASVPTAGDSNTLNNSLTENTTVQAGANFGLNVTGPATAASGSVVTYSLVATNNGPNTATSLTFSFPIPAGLSNITPPAGCTLSGSTYSCVVAGPIANGASVTRNFSGQISAAGGSTVTAAASVINVSPTDPLPANNTASASTSISGGSDVSIGMSRSPSGTLLVGTPVTFTLTPRYTGSAPNGLTVIDNVPANYTINSVTSSGGWLCNTVGQTVTCTNPGGGAPGANVPIGSITINTTTASAGNPTNTATISSAGPVDPNLANNSASDNATITAPVVDLRANKSGPSNPPLVVVGNNYNYSISTTNIGNAAFFGTLVMTDNLPAGLTLTSYGLNGWSCSPAASVIGPATITCQRVYTAGAPLAPNATTPAVTLTTNVTGTGSIVNGMTVSSPNANIADNNPANDTITYGVTSSTGPNSADLSVLKSATPASVVAGDIETFRIEVVNAGPQPSTSISLTDSLTQLINGNAGPTGAGFVSVATVPNAASGVSCSSSSGGATTRNLNCSIATLPVCTAGSNCPVFTVQVRPGGNAGSRTNTARAISSATADPNLGNNNGSANYSVTARADVTVLKSATPSSAVAGQNLTYVVTARNIANGLSAADNVTVTDTLPANLTFVSASPSTGSCSTTPTANSTTGPGNNTVTCNLGTIANGAQQTITIVVRPLNATRGTTINNGATVTTSTPETDTTNNAASLPTPVANPVIDLQVGKDESVDPLAVGDLTVYSVRITNNGPSAAENVVMTDNMPPTLISYQSHTVPAGGSCSTVPAVNSFGGTLTCSFPFIPAGQTRVVTITARGDAKGTATNQVSISSDEIAGGFDTDPLNNADIENTTVRTKADVQVVSKTPSANPVNVRDVFNFVVVIRNNTGPGLDEADNVLVSDSLPANMQLAGAPSAAVVSGTTTSNTCTGASGATSFTCDLGTMSSGAVVNVTLPVRITSVSSLPQNFTNTASVATSSLDVNPANNSNSGSVGVNSSSIAGRVFFDFNDNGAIDPPGDAGLGGVTMTLTGTTFDGQPVNQTVTTQPDGTYLFPFVPQGTYTVTRGATPANATGGTNTPGSAGGSAAPTTISAIALPANTAATDYLFAVIPTARVGIAKTKLVGPTPAADGSFTVTFGLTVTNFSLEALNAMQVTDPLAGGAPLFGNHVSLGNPATDPLARGSYTIMSPPAGSCGGANGGFNGAGAQTVASGFTLAAGASCQLDFEIRVQPTVPLPPVQPSGGRYQNQATVTGTGALSGQTSATNPQLQDLSDDGTNPDPSGNGIANEPGENDPTPVSPAFAPAIALIKTSDTSGVSSPPLAGETVTYAFAITNTGNVALTNVTLTDTLPGIVISGGPIPTLAPGATDATTFTATYALTQPDVDAGQVTNQARAEGTDPFDTPVSDLSGTTNGDDIPLVTPLTAGPAITLIKTATPAFSTPAVPGDTISYAFTVQNTGNVTLTNVTLSDVLAGIVISGGPIATMAPGAIDSTTYTATYALQQSDLDAGQVLNQATATGTPPSGPNVSDLSGATASDDNPTIVPIGAAASIDLIKTADDSDFLDGPDPGDLVRYSFSIQNTGNVTLNNVTLTDVLPGIVITGGPIASLAPNATDTTTYTATYAPTAADFTAGTVQNTATATGFYGPGNALSVNDADSASAFVVAIDANPEVFPPFATNGGTTTSMLASDTVRGVPATLANVTITVIATDPELVLNPATGLITLLPDSPAGTYTVTYEICSVAPPVICDQATETVIQLPRPGIEVTKTQAVVDNGDGRNGVGDRVDYTITVENTGNVPLSNVVLTDTLTSLAGAPLSLDSGPSFVSASAGSPAGDLQIAEIATYTASYTLTIAAVTDGGISNTATADALPVFGPGVPGIPSPISDVSDDGNDADGNTTNDPTVLVIRASLAPTGLTVTKTTPRGVVERGSVVPYTIKVKNDNPVVSGTLNIVDALPAGFLYVPGSATLGGAPYPVTVQGRIVTWPNVPVPPLTTVTATIQARVLSGADAGEHINTVSIRNPATNALLAPRATATVRILPEPVFDCGDVIGKVFDDKNRDGYQNDPGPAPITDQDYVADGKYGKYDVAPALEESRGEPGIPGVRLAGVDGTIITTDPYGRFHVPCAMLPADHGSNFILKLDTRSLPSGYRVTTENPRVVRLTPGKMTEMNFGAAITRVVRLDLNARAFTGDAEGRAALSPALVNGIAALLPRIAGEPANLRLAYHLPKGAGAEDVKRARGLMRLVEKHIREKWRDVGRVKLTVEQTIVRSGE
ncbi:MAG: SdrD B-like domain-containing protein [Paracoccaceae bacterium]